MSALRIIKMTNEGIFFDEEEFVPYANTNLPKEHFRFKDRIRIYWMVELNPIPGYRAAKKVQVKSYKPVNIHLFADQAKMKAIPFLQFEKLDGEAFLGLCESYDLPWLERLFSNPPKPATVKSVGLLVNPAPVVPNPISLPIVQEHSVEFRLKFADATIVDGAIVFEQRLEGIYSNLVFEIQNQSLKAPYDTIKEYIARKLGRKTFRVTATIKQYGWTAVVENAHSEEIARIDESFIQKVKEKQIKSLLNVKRSDGRSLSTVDELLSLSDELKGNFLQTSVENIIEVLTNNAEHRNAKQLGYLAKKQDLAEVVYLTASPYFGFVFYLRENNQRSYVWELLDSHATYIWRFEKEDGDRKQEFDRVEQSINEIREGGRNAYKNKYHSGEIIADCRFDTIQHAVNRQSADKTFDEWLAELKNKTKQRGLE